MTSSGEKILVIDDEPQIQKLLRVTLQAQDFEVIAALSGKDGLLHATMVRPDLIVLDLGLPDISGMEVLRSIRDWTQTPIVVLTAKDQEEDKIVALDSGADDYVTKPFGMGELVARIRVALRHTTKSNDEPILNFGRLVIDLSKRDVELDGQKVKLTPTEYELLKVLATNAGRVMTHKQLLQKVWGGHQYNTDSHYLRVYVGHLRKKIELEPARPTFIVTDPGIGYRFMVDS
jgi:two-component system KDP operon response regulator KdpE